MLKIFVPLLVILWIWYLLFNSIDNYDYYDNYNNYYDNDNNSQTQGITWTQPLHRLDYEDSNTMLMYNVNVSQCVNLCDTDSKCKGFVYVPRKSLCKFKSDFTKPKFRRGHITYVKE